MKEGLSPYDPDQSVEIHLRGEAAHTDSGTQAPATTSNMTNGQIPLQNPPKRCTQYNQSYSFK